MIFSLHSTYVKAEEPKRAYLDERNNFHLIPHKGEHRQITHKGNASRLKFAPDKQTVAWLVLNTWTAEGDNRPGSEELVVYRNGRAASIKCGPFIRDYWFWKNGDKIAIDCGGRNFAGREILYDTKTLKELASFDQGKVPLEKRPDWSDKDD